MTEMASEAQEPFEQQASDSPEETPEPSEGGNPAWQEFLDVLPSQLHSVVRPVLEKWDKGVQDRFQTIHSEYEPYKTYAPIVESGIPLETIDTALRILNGLEQNPQKVYEAIGQYYNFSQAAQEQAPQAEEEDEEFQTEFADPRITELQAKFDSMAKVLYEKFSLEQQQQQDAALATELGRLTQQYGAFDENFVLSQMLQNVSPEDAVKNYHSLVENIKAEALANNPAKPQAPRVLGSGGGNVASQAVDPKQLSDSDTRKLVAQMLERAQRS